MTALTTKQAAARVRTHLNQAVKAADRGGYITFASGYELRLPPGLRLNVRATKTGVNVQIKDGYAPSYVDNVTGGDRRAFNREHANPVVKLLEEYEQQIWGSSLGEIQWGSIAIGVSAVARSSVVGGGAA